MNAPLLWFILPIVVAGGLFLIQNDKSVSILAGFFSLILFSVAAFLPPDTPFTILTVAFKFEPTLQFFGRVFSLTHSDKIPLMYVYGFGSFWFFCTLAYNNSRKAVIISLAILGIMIGAIAVEPFLYSAILLEIAALIAIPFLVREGQTYGRGLVRFLINQTLGLPFILLAGFLLSGVEAGPDDLAIVLQAMLMLGLGFAFLLSVFPFYTWAPMLSEEIEPYKLAFILLTFPLISLLIGLDFIDKYAWLRSSEILFNLLQVVGLILILSASIWAAFQNHLGRIFAFSLVSSTGYALIALSSSDHILGLESFFLLILPNLVTFGLWSYSITLLDEKTNGLWKEDIRGAAYKYPYISAGIAFSGLTVTGIPLLAMFPIKVAIWGTLAVEQTTSSTLYGLAFIGFFIASARSFSAMLATNTFTGWKSNETQNQKTIILLLVLLLILLGLFPSLFKPSLDLIIEMFPNLAQLN